MAINAGQLDRQVTIIEATTAVDGSGQRVHTYATSTTITPAARYARIRWLSGAETVRADNLVIETECEVTLRYEPLLTSVYRFTTDASSGGAAETLEISSVIHDERKSMTVCRCKRAT